MSTLTQFFGVATGVPCEVLVVGGGGGGALTSNNSGGQIVSDAGGAGRLNIGLFTVPFGTSSTVTIGAGGAAGLTTGSDGSTSSALYSFAGGGGGNGRATVDGILGSLSGITGTAIASFGPAFTSSAHQGGDALADSGGGAGGPGSGVTKGPGLTLSITGTSTTYAAGGQGGASNYQGGAAGAANTGDGGGGYVAGFNSSSNFPGGSGIVVIAYPDTFGAATCTGTFNEPTRSGYRVYRFTGSGSITFPTS